MRVRYLNLQRVLITLNQTPAASPGALKNTQPTESLVELGQLTIPDQKGNVLVWITSAHVDVGAFAKWFNLEYRPTNHRFLTHIKGRLA